MSGSPEYKSIVTQFRDINLSIVFVDDGAFYGPPHALIERIGAFARICSIRGIGSFSKKKTQLSMVNRNPVEPALVVRLAADALDSDADRS